MEVMAESPLRPKNGVHQLLIMWVALLGLGEDLANVVHRSLDSVLLSFLGLLDNHDGTDGSISGGDVHKHGLFWSGGGEYGCVL
jgi:hypothetical protein